MGQNIIELADVKIETDEYGLEIIGGVPRVYSKNLARDPDNLAEDEEETDYNSMTEFFFSDHYTINWEVCSLIKKMDEADMYPAMVEHCAMELKDITLLGWIIGRLIPGSKRQYPREALIEMIRRDPSLRQHKGFLDGNYTPTDRVNEKIKCIRTDILEKSGIDQQLMDFFRQSDSLVETYEKIRTDRVFKMRLEEIEEAFWDADKKTLVEYIKNNGKNQ